ncbi:MAG: hypothetical protein ACT4O5_03565 [Gammaproteobacteria bacterium]
MPIIRRRAYASLDPLPPAWRTTQNDRGFAAELASALGPGRADVPWKFVRFMSSGEELDRVLLEELKGQNAAVALLDFELIDLPRGVQFTAHADVTFLQAAGTSCEVRKQSRIRHVSTTLPITRARMPEDPAAFVSGGRLDQLVAQAVVDLSGALAVFVRDASDSTSIVAE